MKVSELGLPGAAEQKLAQLAISIEIHCRQRFSTCKTVMEIAAMLIIADTCEIELVRRRKEDFINALPARVRPVLESLTGGQDCIGILEGRGVSYRGRKAVLSERVVAAPGAGLSYRGSHRSGEEGEVVSPAVRQVRMYRGRIVED